MLMAVVDANLEFIYTDVDTTTTVVRACCLLHNFLRRKCGRGYITEAMCSTDPEGPIAACELQPIYPAVGRKPPSVAKQTRECLGDYFLDVGAVPWQDKILNL